MVGGAAVSDRARDVGPVSASRGRPSGRWLGLDLGSASIKLVEVERQPGQLRVTNRLIQELPVGQEAESVDRAGWLQAALKEFSGTRVHLAVTGPEVAIRRVRVPAMSAHEMKEAVRWLVKDDLPFPVQEAVVDCRIVGDVWDKDIRKLDVLVAAMAGPGLREVVALVEKAGGAIASVVPASVALWQGLRHACPDKLEASVAVVELGAEQTHTVVLKDGVPRVARDLPIGSQHFTQALIGEIASDHGQVRVDAAMAERIKRQYGIIPESEHGATEEGVPLGHLAALMRGVLETLLIELARFLDFYKVQMHEAGVARILLCGGGANLKHLRAFLEEGLGIPVELFDPLRPGAAAPGEADEPLLEGGGESRLAVAFGAAVGHGETLDCTPPEVRARQWQDRVSRALRVAGAAAPAVVGLLYALLLAAAWWGSRDLRSLDRAWERLRPAHEEAVRLATGTARMDAILRTVEQLTQRQPLWGGVFKELSHLTPGNIALSELAMVRPASAADAGALRLRGSVWPRQRGEDAALSDFLEGLERSVFFRDVRLNSSQLQSSPAGTTWFELECGLE